MVKRAELKLRVVHKDETPKIGHNEGQNQDEFLIHIGSILKAKTAVDAVKKTLKAARRLANDAGYNLADMDEAISMREQEPETVQATILRKAQYASWLGTAPPLTQGDLFSSAKGTPDEEVWYNEGREDGLMGLSNKGDRYDTTTEAGQNRGRGWNDGNERREVVKKQQLEQFKENEKAANAAKAAKAAKKAVEEPVH